MTGEVHSNTNQITGEKCFFSVIRLIPQWASVYLSRLPHSVAQLAICASGKPNIGMGGPDAGVFAELEDAGTRLAWGYCRSGLRGEAFTVEALVTRGT